MGPSNRNYTAVRSNDEVDEVPLAHFDTLHISKQPEHGSDSIDSVDDPDETDFTDSSLLGGSLNIPRPQGYLTFLHGVALTISLQIGAGIFSTPSQVAQNVASPGAAVLVWITGGLLSWTGAASLIELGLAIPRNGGVQEYLSHIWGDFSGFLCSWMTIFLLRPGSMAIVSMVFSEHLSHAIFPASFQSNWTSKLLAIVGVGIIAVINCLDLKHGAHTATAFLVLKLLAVTSIILLGLLSIFNKTDWMRNSPGGWFGGEVIMASSSFGALGHYATAIFGALYAYGGSSAVGEVAGDMKDPQRDIPRIVNVCMAITMLSAVSMNIAFFEVLPLQTIRDRLVPAVDLGIRVGGPAAGIIYSLVVSMSAIGSINSALFAGARQYIASAERGYIPAIFDNLHYGIRTDELIYYDNTLKGLPYFIRAPIKSFARRTEKLRIEERVPVYAVTISYLLGSLYILVGTFNGFIVFGGIATSMFNLLMVAGLFKLRRANKEGDATLPLTYRAWTVNPVLYLLITLIVTLAGMAAHPYLSVAVLAFVVMGYLVYRATFARGKEHRVSA